MKIVKQSFEILPELADPIKQIASAARICYKSEDKAQEDERPFLTRIKKHEPIFEMAVVSLKFGQNLSLFHAVEQSKYLHCSNNSKGELLVTGSIRAWREWVKTTNSTLCISVRNVLYNYNSFLFNSRPGDHSIDKVEVIDVDTEPCLNGNDAYKLHKHVAVKFITNRAVSHELVRHRPVAFLQESQRYCRYNDEVVFIDPRPAFPVFETDATNFEIWEQTCRDAEASYLELLRFKASPQAARTVLPNSCKTEIIVYCNLKEWEHIFNRRTSLAAEPSMIEAMHPVWEFLNNRFRGLFKNPQLSVG